MDYLIQKNIRICEMLGDFDNLKKALIGSGMLTALLFWMRFIKSRNRYKQYKSQTGAINYSFIFIDIFVHIGFSVLGAWLVFMLFNTQGMKSLIEYQVIAAVLGGATFREIVPMLIELFIDEVDNLIEKRKRSR